MENVPKIWAQGEQLVDVYERFLVFETQRHFDKSGRTPTTYSRVRPLNDAARKRAVTAMRQELVASKICAIGMSNDGKKRAPQPIPPEFWVAAKIEPDQCRAWQPGYVFDEITVAAPAYSAAVTSADRPEIVQARVAASPASYPAKAGATSYAEEREIVIIACFDKYEDFGRWSFVQRQRTLIAEAARLYPNRDWARGFGRTAIYKSIQELTNSGRLASDNVR